MILYDAITSVVYSLRTENWIALLKNSNISHIEIIIDINGNKFKEM